MSAESKPKYITQLTGKWLDDVSALLDMSGEGFIKVENRGGKMVVRVDENLFKLAVYAILSKTVTAAGFNYVKPQNYDLDFNYRN